MVIRPGWDLFDEERYDERQAAKKRTATRKTNAAKRHKASSAGSKKRPPTFADQESEGEAKR